MHQLNSFFSTPKILPRVLIFASFLALMSGLVAEYVFKLRPCSLCLYQQYVFISICFVGCSASLMPFFKTHSKKISLILAVLFVINAGIAFYQVAVEHRWVEAPSQCQSKKLSGNSIEELREELLNTDVVRCDQIQWSLFGISMAGYNVIYSLFWGLFAFYFLRRHKQ